MNRLKKIFSFVLCLSFSLLLNVSYAVEFSATPIGSSSITLTQGKANDTNFSTRTYGGYTLTQISSIINNYYNSVDIPSYDSMLSALKSANYELTLIYNEAWGNSYPYNYVLMKKGYFDFGLFYNTSRAGIYFSPLVENFNIYEDLIYAQSTLSSNTYSVYYIGPNSSQSINAVYGQSINKLTTSDYIQSSTVSVKQLAYNNGYAWDGSSYSFIASNTGDDTPSLPSNSEIAQAVQSFYNSDYYKNNKDFKDFIVMYNYKTKYFDFIGHNFENKLGQQIIDAGVSIGSPPVSYNERWWHYYIVGFSEFTSTLFNKYYWLYSTNDFGENIKYEGKGSINDLLDLHFATSSIIVYSTTDYPVNTVFKNDNDEIESSAEVMPGDHYTYNENLDPTTNEYDPLTNFVPTDPSQNILGNVDFDEINKVFEENKNILNIKNASWLFTANNQLVNYFIGFLSFLIVLIIISRLLGG